MAMKNIYSTIGIMIGGLALMLSLVQFFVGPFTPKQSLKPSISEEAAFFRDAAMSLLKGKKVEEPPKSRFDIDKAILIVTAVLGGIAFIFAALSFANHEPKRAAGAAAAMGASAVAFQFIAVYVMVFLVVLAVLAAISVFGDGL